MIEKITNYLYKNNTSKINEIIDELNRLLSDCVQTDELNAKISQINSQINNVNTRVSTNGTNIATLQNRLTALQNSLLEQWNLGKQYIDTNDFCNMAPKIGYYQEDQIQVFSTYEISNVPLLEKNAPVFTSDNVGREIMYIIADGGGANASSTTGLRKAYRISDIANWIWYNKDIVPACFKNTNTRIDRIYGCDNTYLIFRMKDRSYQLVHTNYSFYEDEWQNADDITSMVTDIAGDRIIHIKYLEDYDTLITFNSIASALTIDKWYRVRVYRYSTKELLCQQDIDGLAQYTVMCNGYSFLPDRSVRCIYTDLTDEERRQYGAFDVSISGTESAFACNVTLLEKQETLVICRCGMQYYAYNEETGVRTWLSASQIPITYHFPLSFAKGIPGKDIVCNLHPGDVSIGDSTPFLDGLSNAFLGSGRSLLFGNGGVVNSSYDTLRGYVYRSGKVLATPHLGFSRTKMNSIEEDPRYSCLKFDYVKANLLTPDASYWGKYFQLGLALWDTIFLSCINSENSYLVWVKEWRLVKDHESNLIVEPVPGKYKTIDPTKFTNVLRQTYDPQLYTFTTKHPKRYASTFGMDYGFTSVKMPDGTPRYFKSEYTNGQIKTREFLKKELYDDDGNMDTFEIESQDLTPLFVTIPASSFNTGNSADTFLFGCHVIYNPMANMYFMFGVLDYGDRSTNDNIARNHLVGIKTDGTIVSYGEPKDHPWPFSDGKINNYNTNYQTPWMPYGSNWIDAHTMQGCFNEGHNGGRGTIIVTFRFNEDYSDYEVVKVNSIPGGIFWLGAGRAMSSTVAHCLIYAGPRLGFCGQGETRVPNAYTDNYKMDIRTQYPLFGTQDAERSYTDEEIINDPLYANINTYTMYNRSASGLICYISPIPIFLGGYYSDIVNAIPVPLEPNLNSAAPESSDGRYDANYIYLERENGNRQQLKAYASPLKIINEGSAMFNKILIARVETDEEKAISTQLYSINTGYNDWKFH